MLSHDSLPLIPNPERTFVYFTEQGNSYKTNMQIAEEYSKGNFSHIKIESQKDTFN